MMKKLGRKSKYFIFALSGSLIIALLRGFSLAAVVDGMSIVTIILLIITLCKVVGNIGLLDSFIFGAKMIGELLRNKRELLASGSDGYYEYRKNKRRSGDVWDLGVITVIFFAISAFSAVAVSM